MLSNQYNTLPNRLKCIFSCRIGVISRSWAPMLPHNTYRAHAPQNSSGTVHSHAKRNDWGAPSHSPPLTPKLTPPLVFRPGFDALLPFTILLYHLSALPCVGSLLNSALHVFASCLTLERSSACDCRLTMSHRGMPRPPPPCPGATAERAGRPWATVA